MLHFYKYNIKKFKHYEGRKKVHGLQATSWPWVAGTCCNVTLKNYACVI